MLSSGEGECNINYNDMMVHGIHHHGFCGNTFELSSLLTNKRLVYEFLCIKM